MDMLEMEKEKFAKELVNLGRTFEDIKNFNVYEQVKEYATQTNGLKDTIDGAYDLLKSFNEREVIFK